MTDKKKKNLSLIIILSLTLIAIPCINIIDLFPDFLGYFLLAYAIGRSADIVPYLQEARSSLIKLGFLTLAKFPAMLLMFANLYTGRDIIPLFTMIFGVCEAILLVPCIMNSFAGLFYLGERCESNVLLTPVLLFGKRMRIETLKNLTYTFALTKCALSILPELCLLTFSSAKVSEALAMAYPFLLLLALFASLLFGIIWLIGAVKYVTAIKRDGNIGEDILAMAGEERLSIIETKRWVKMLTRTLTVLAVSCVFSVDLAFDNTGGVNILPHFIFGLFLLYVAVRIFDDKRIKIWCSVWTGLYTAFGLIAHIFTIRFLDRYEYLDMLDFEPAIKAYIPVEIFSVLETLCFVILGIFTCIGFLKFIKEHTGLSPRSERYGRTEREYHKRMSIKAVILFAFMCLVSVCKCISVFLKADVKTIFTDTGMIVTTSMPWADAVIIGMSVLLISYAFYYISDVKADVRMKYSDTETKLRDERLE